MKTHDCIWGNMSSLYIPQYQQQECHILAMSPIVAIFHILIKKYLLIFNREEVSHRYQISRMPSSSEQIRQQSVFDLKWLLIDLIRKRRSPQMGKHWNHWRDMEEILYHFYLIIQLKKFQRQRRKSDLIFKEMEAFIRSRTSIECRSHHIRKGNNIIKQLKAFIHDHYQIRYLDVRHALKELRYYLRRKNTTFLIDFSGRTQKRIELEWVLSQFQENWQIIQGETPPISFTIIPGKQTADKDQFDANKGKAEKDKSDNKVDNNQPISSLEVRLDGSGRPRLDQHYM